MRASGCVSLQCVGQRNGEDEGTVEKVPYDGIPEPGPEAVAHGLDVKSVDTKARKNKTRRAKPGCG